MPSSLLLTKRVGAVFLESCKNSCFQKRLNIPLRKKVLISSHTFGKFVHAVIQRIPKVRQKAGTSTWRSLWETQMVSPIQGVWLASGSIAFINILLQCQLSDCTTIPGSNSGSGALSAYSDPGSCNRCPEFHSQARTCSSSTGVLPMTSELPTDLTKISHSQ